MGVGASKDDLSRDWSGKLVWNIDVVLEHLQSYSRDFNHRVGEMRKDKTVTSVHLESLLMDTEQKLTYYTEHIPDTVAFRNRQRQDAWSRSVPPGQPGSGRGSGQQGGHAASQNYPAAGQPGSGRGSGQQGGHAARQNYPAAGQPGSGRGSEQQGEHATRQNYPAPRHAGPDANIQQYINTLIDEHEILLKRKEDDNARLKMTTKKLEKENQDLMLRLSKVAAENLTYDNPAIADLSDRNRPTKLGEFYSELYDNEWTDAYDELTKGGYSETEAINTLRDTLLDVHIFCQEKAKSMVEKAADVIDGLFDDYKHHQTLKFKSQADVKAVVVDRRYLEKMKLQARWKPKRPLQGAESEPQHHTDDMKKTIAFGNLDRKLMGFRKDISTSILPVIQKAYLKAVWDRECMSAVKPFIKKCLFVGWMMVVQTPPLCLDATQPGEPLNSAMYKAYTKSGTVITMVVWPALKLHEGGPVVSKGVAQGDHQ